MSSKYRIVPVNEIDAIGTAHLKYKLQKKFLWWWRDYHPYNIAFKTKEHVEHIVKKLLKAEERETRKDI